MGQYKHPKKEISVLSLGGGVQSSCLALMSAREEIEPYDYIIFADTGNEPTYVRQYIGWLMKELLKYQIEIHVAAGPDGLQSVFWDLWKGVTDNARFASIPYFIKMPDGSIVPGRRQCTSEYKIDAKNRLIRDLLGYEKGERNKHHVHMHLGISADEEHRAKASTLHWQTNHFPLIEMGMYRYDCEQWFVDNGYPVPHKSSCAICPYHSNDEWRKLKTLDPDNWNLAVKLDKLIRHGMQERGLIGETYLHWSGIPLEEVDFSAEQLSLFNEIDLFRFECAGVCAV